MDQDGSSYIMDQSSCQTLDLEEQYWDEPREECSYLWVPEEKCLTKYKEEYTTRYQQECHDQNSQQCYKEEEQVCGITTEAKVDDITKRKCNTETEQQCPQVPEKKCHCVQKPVMTTKYEQQCSKSTTRCQPKSVPRTPGLWVIVYSVKNPAQSTRL